MQKIMPHLWFDKEAKEAVEFYCSIFPDSKITNFSTLHNTPTGDSDILSFELCGEPFMAISAGPIFKINPAISFHVKCRSAEEVNALWETLSPGGVIRMALGTYPFSKRYGWIEDRFGVSWQLIQSDGEDAARIVPVLIFTQRVCGKAEEAINFYASVFPESKVEFLARYEAGDSTVDKSGTIKYGHFVLAGKEFGAMDSARIHEFTFNEGISLIVPCDDQSEVDRYWEKLSADPNSEQCGWCKDKFGVSWQVWPVVLGDMLTKGTPKQVAQVTQVFLGMKKFDIAKLQEAFRTA